MRSLKFIWAGILAAALAACGGGAISPSYSVGGSVTGATGSLVLSMNYVSSTEDLTVPANSSGSFTFRTQILSGGASTVSVKNHPENQLCTVSGGDISGISANVTNVAVSCVNAGWRVSTLSAYSDDANWVDNSSANYHALDIVPSQIFARSGNTEISFADNATNNTYLMTRRTSSLYFSEGSTNETASVMTFRNNAVAYFTEGGNIYKSDRTLYATANLDSPKDMVLDAAGNLYVSDSGNFVIKKIDTQGQVSILAGTAGSAGNTDGVGNNASFNYPWGLAIDSQNSTLYVADTFSHSIRYINLSTREVGTLAGATDGTFGFVDGDSSSARFKAPAGLAIDAANNLYVADWLNNLIRKVTSDFGATTTLAGSDLGFVDGLASQAKFNAPKDIAVTADGQTIYVTETGNKAVRRIKFGPLP
jgi:DNA-binding beta-propeller fold protein YncE